MTNNKKSKYWLTMVDILDGQFPKKKCKERGQAMVMLAYIEMMLLGIKFGEDGMPKTEQHSKSVSEKGKKQNDWEDELFELAEKYCQHNDTDKFNNCLYWIFRPVIVKALKAKDKEFIEILDGLEIWEAGKNYTSKEVIEITQKISIKIGKAKQKYA